MPVATIRLINFMGPAMPSRKTSPRKARIGAKTFRSRKARARKVKKAAQSDLTRTGRKVASTAEKLWRSAEDLLASAKKSAKRRLAA